MGIFDKSMGNREVELTPHGGLLLAAISMVAIDGDVDDDELAIEAAEKESGIDRCNS